MVLSIQLFGIWLYTFLKKTHIQICLREKVGMMSYVYVKSHRYVLHKSSLLANGAILTEQAMEPLLMVDTYTRFTFIFLAKVYIKRDMKL